MTLKCNTCSELKAELERQRITARTAEKSCVNDCFEGVPPRVDQLEVDRLRKALEWYADHVNYLANTTSSGPVAEAFRMICDRGRRARKALGRGGSEG